MNIAVVYQSRTGITRAAAQAMAGQLERKGHSCSVVSVEAADPATVAQADLVCLGSWTAGLFIMLQRPPQPIIRLIKAIGDCQGKKFIVFCTYKLAIGKMLDKMSKPILAQGGEVIGAFKFKGPNPDTSFNIWSDSFAARKV